MKSWWKLAAVVAALTLSGAAAHAATLTEGFDDPFPVWERGWLAQNSNLENYYGVGAGRGNQPLGLWVEDDTRGDAVDIMFDRSFGAQWSSLSLDVATWVDNTLEVYDIDNNILATLTGFTTRSYSQSVNFVVESTNGFGGFRFTNSRTPGNTWIDNVTVNDDNISPVPLPASGLMLMAGLGGLAAARKRRTR